MIKKRLCCLFFNHFFCCLKTQKNKKRVIFSSILKTVSNKRKIWNNGYIANKVLPNVKYTGDTLKVFESRYKAVRKSFAELEEVLKNNQ